MNERGEGWVAPGTVLALVGRALTSIVFWLFLAAGGAGTATLLYFSKPVFRSDVTVFYRRPAGADFVSQTDGDPARQLAARLKEMLFTREHLSTLISEFKLYPDIVARRGLMEAVEEMRKKRMKFESSAGDTFRVSFEAESPQLAQAVVSRATEMLLEFNRLSHTSDALSAQRFFDSQKRAFEDELHAREAEYASFLADHPELAAATGPGPVTPGAPLRAATADPRLSAQSSLVSALEARIAHLREHGSDLPKSERRTSESGAGSVDPALLAERDAAQADLVAARRELSQKQKQFTSEYPDVREAMAAVSTAKERLHRAEDAIAAAKRASATILPTAAETVSNEAPESAGTLVRRRLQAVEKQLAQARAKASERDPRRLMELGVQLAELDRGVAEARDRLAVIQSKQFQASLQATVDLEDPTGELEVVDPAFLPAVAERGGRFKLGLVGGLASLALAVGFGLLRVLVNDRLRAAFDLPRLRLPVLLVRVRKPPRRRKKEEWNVDVVVGETP